jgi:Tol biopolymer transport system component
MSTQTRFRLIALPLLVVLVLANTVPAAGQAPPLAQPAIVFPWIRQLGTSQDDTANAIAVTPSGAIVVAGMTEGSLGAQAYGEDDIWVAMFDVTGGLLWLRQYGGPEDETVSGIAVSKTGDLYVVGRTGGLMFSDVPEEEGGYVLALSSVGDERWHSFEPDDKYTAVAVDESAVYVVSGTRNVYVNAATIKPDSAVIAAFDLAGSRRWRTEISDFTLTSALTVSRLGDKVVVGGSGASLVQEQIQTHLWSATLDLSGAILHLDRLEMSQPGYFAIPSAIIAGHDGEPLMVGVAASTGVGGHLSFGWQAQMYFTNGGHAQWNLREVRTGADAETIAGLTEVGNAHHWLSGVHAEFSEASSQFSEGFQVWLADMHRGSLRWVESFGGNAWSTVTAPVYGADGGIYVAGATTGDFAGVNQGDEDIWVMRVEVDALGTPRFPAQLQLGEQATPAPQPQRSEFTDVAGRIIFVASSKKEGSTDDVWTAPHHLFAVNPDGSGLAQITREGFTPWKSAAVSPDGKLIAQASTNQSPVKIIDPSGSTVVEVDHPGRRAHPVDWSAKTGLILFLIVESFGTADEDQDLWTLSYPQLEWTQLTSDDEVLDWDAAWSPDGQQIAVERSNQIWIMNADGSEPRKISDQSVRFLDWSPDGSRIAFQSLPITDQRNGWDLWVMQTDGSNAQNITEDPTWFEENPEWSPDGRFIAYDASTDMSGASNLFVLDLETGNRQVIVEGGNNLEPMWVPGAMADVTDEGLLLVEDKMAMQTIGFVYEDAVWTIQADGSTVQRLTDPAQIGKTLAFAWSPDGTRMALLAQQTDASPRLLSLDLASGDISVLLEEVQGVKVAWSGEKLIVLLSEAPSVDLSGYVWENKLLILDLVTGQAETITAEDDDWLMPAMGGIPFSYVTVSADGQWILFVDAAVQGFARMGGAGYELGEDLGYLLYPQWMGDASLISYSVSDGTMNASGAQAYQFDPETGSTRSLANSAEYIDVTSDGQYAVVTDPTLMRLNLSSEKRFQLTDDRAATPLWAPDGSAILYRRTVYDPELIGGAKMGPDWESGTNWKIVTADGQYQRLLLPGDATDPAWQPSVGGEWVNLEPPLRYNGHMYAMGIRAGGLGLISDPWNLFADYMAESEALLTQNVTDVRLLRDGELVTDYGEAEEVLQRYLAAYLLYRAQSDSIGFDDLETIDAELRRVTANSLWRLTYGLGTAATREDTQWRQLLRAMVAQQVDSDDIAGTAKIALQDAIGQESIGAALNLAALSLDDAGMREAVLRMGLYFQDWKIVQNGIRLRDRFWPISNSQILQLIGLVFELAIRYQPASENIELLQEYEQMHPEGEYAFSDMQRVAVNDVTAEVEVDWQRASDLVEEYAIDMGADFMVTIARPAFGLSYVRWVAEKKGAESVFSFLTGHMARMIGGAGVAYTVGGFVMGLDELYEHFTMAEHANALRRQFRDARMGTLAQASENSGSYDAELAQRYLTELRLEMLSAVQTRTSYIDGISATVEKGVVSPIYLSNLITGVDWEDAARQLQATTYEQFADFQLSTVDRPALKSLALMAVMHSNLEEPQLPAQAPTQSDAWIAVVIEGPLNLRAEPSTEAIAVGLIEVGVELSMLGQTADGLWLNVRTKDGDEGWVFAQYVEVRN